MLREGTSYEQISREIEGNTPSTVETGRPGIRPILLKRNKEINEPTKIKSSDKAPIKAP